MNYIYTNVRKSNS